MDPVHIYSDIDWTMMGPGEDLDGVCDMVRRLLYTDYKLILVTAKSIYEILPLLDRICLPLQDLIAIVESGGAIYTYPNKLTLIDGSRRIMGRRLEYIELGKPINEFKEIIEEAVDELDCSVRYLSGADEDTAVLITRLSRKSAVYSTRREYLEVIWSPRQSCLDELSHILASKGLYVFRSSRLLHVGMHGGKLAGIRIIHGDPVMGGGNAITIGLGDSEADKEYLEYVDYPIVIPVPGYGVRVRLMRSDYMIARNPAPYGWVEALESLLYMLF